MSPEKLSRFATFENESHKRIPSISGLPSTLSRPNDCLSLQKQPARVFDFKRDFKLHQKRLELSELPLIYSKEKKVKGNLSIEKVKPRDLSMYDMRAERPEYKPKFELTEPRSPGLVNYGAKRMSDYRKLIEEELEPQQTKLGRIRLKRKLEGSPLRRAFGLEV